jgi:hypothetical protein
MGQWDHRTQQNTANLFRQMILGLMVRFLEVVNGQ